MMDFNPILGRKLEMELLFFRPVTKKVALMSSEIHSALFLVNWRFAGEKVGIETNGRWIPAIQQSGHGGRPYPSIEALSRSHWVMRF